MLDNRFKSPGVLSSIVFSIVICLLCLPLLFLKRDVDPGFIPFRSMKHAWDFAHFPLFTCFIYLVITFIKPLRVLRFDYQLMVVVTGTMILGLGIEIIQIYIGRYFQWQDVMWDLLGAYFVVLIINRGNKEKKYYRLAIVIFVLGFSLAMMPLARSVLDEYRASNEFPVLADFSSSLQLQRFGNRNSLIFHKTGVERQFTTEKYSGFSLDYFPRDWSAYDMLTISLENEASHSVNLTCRVHDWGHHEAYNDRYNQQFTIPPGPYTISIQLEDIQSAPKGRQMDLTRLGAVGCFTVELEHPVTMSITRIELLQY
jgi:hypothetical protein